MEARDGGVGFEFAGTCTGVKEHAVIAYTMADDRRVVITFEPVAGGTKVSESFDAEDTNSAGMQKTGWQAVCTASKVLLRNNHN